MLVLAGFVCFIFLVDSILCSIHPRLLELFAQAGILLPSVHGSPAWQPLGPPTAKSGSLELVTSCPARTQGMHLLSNPQAAITLIGNR